MTPEMKVAIVEAIFRRGTKTSNTPVDNPQSDSFWSFYLRLCSKVVQKGGVQTHGDVLDLVEQVRAGHTRAEIRDMFRGRVQAADPLREDRLLDMSMDLAARLVTMSNFGSSNFFKDTELDRVPWPDMYCLSEVVDERFQAENKLKDMKVKLERSFTALSLDRVAGISIVWTWNLLDHLKLTDDDKVVHIFTCMGCVHWQHDK